MKTAGMSTRRALGTGPTTTTLQRDKRGLTVAERAVAGDWVEVREPVERTQEAKGRRVLGGGAS